MKYCCEASARIAATCRLIASTEFGPDSLGRTDLYRQPVEGQILLLWDEDFVMPGRVLRALVQATGAATCVALLLRGLAVEGAHHRRGVAIPLDGNILHERVELTEIRG